MSHQWRANKLVKCQASPPVWKKQSMDASCKLFIMTHAYNLLWEQRQTLQQIRQNDVENNWQSPLGVEVIMTSNNEVRWRCYIAGVGTLFTIKRHFSFYDYFTAHNVMAADASSHLFMMSWSVFVLCLLFNHRAERKIAIFFGVFFKSWAVSVIRYAKLNFAWSSSRSSTAATRLLHKFFWMFQLTNHKTCLDNMMSVGIKFCKSC